MTRDVNAPGTLEPEYVRNITALTSGRVEDLPVRPGVSVTTSTVLVVMSNPDEEIKALQNEQKLNQAVGNLASLKTTLQQQILGQQGSVANMRTQYNNAVRLAAVQDSLAKKKLVVGERRRRRARPDHRDEAAPRHRAEAARRHPGVRAAADRPAASSRSRASSAFSTSRSAASPPCA